MQFCETNPIPFPNRSRTLNSALCTLNSATLNFPLDGSPMRVVPLEVASTSTRGVRTHEVDPRFPMRTSDFSTRDQAGSVVFYVLLWKRHGISLDLFDDYWRNVHGPV